MLDRHRIRELLEKVPRFQDDPLPKGATEAEISAFEERVKIKLPEDHREFLKIVNGAWVDPGIFGIRPSDPYLDIEATLAFFPSWRERGWIPVAADGCGNLYVLTTMKELGPRDPVFFSDHEYNRNSPRYIVASDFEHFLSFFLEAELGEERWAFDREYVIQRDPNILECRREFLPWEVDKKRSFNA